MNATRLSLIIAAALSLGATPLSTSLNEVQLSSVPIEKLTAELSPSMTDAGFTIYRIENTKGEEMGSVIVVGQQRIRIGKVTWAAGSSYWIWKDEAWPTASFRLRTQHRSLSAEVTKDSGFDRSGTYQGQGPESSQVTQFAERVSTAQCDASDLLATDRFYAVQEVTDADDVVQRAVFQFSPGRSATHPKCLSDDLLCPQGLVLESNTIDDIHLEEGHSLDFTPVFRAPR